MEKTNSKKHGGKRANAGRKPSKYPTQLLKIKATDDELQMIHKRHTTRERAEKLTEFRCVLCHRVYEPHHHNCTLNGLCDNCRTERNAEQLIKWRLSLRRAEKAGSEASLKFYEWIEALNDFGWTCAYCGSDCGYKQPTMEHFMSISKGGGTTRGNCVPACKSCNARKDNASGCTIPLEQMERVRLYLIEREAVAIDRLYQSEKEIQMNPKLASEMTEQELEQYVAQNSQYGDPDASLQDWISGSDLSTETPDDVVAEWDAGR